jgi:hypothetical protein
MEQRPPAPEVAILADVFAVLKRRTNRIAAPGSHRVFRESATRVVIETFPASPPVAANDHSISIAGTIA